MIDVDVDEHRSKKHHPVGDAHDLYAHLMTDHGYSPHGLDSVDPDDYQTEHRTDHRLGRSEAESRRHCPSCTCRES